MKFVELLPAALLATHSFIWGKKTKNVYICVGVGVLYVYYYAYASFYSRIA